MRKMALLLLACCCAAASRAQFAPERSLTRKGNELYEQGKWAEAAAAYNKAEQKNPTFTPGVFNMGAALIQQKQYEAARRALANAAKTSKDPQVQGAAHYNTGNTYMTEQQWQKALDAYKAALRRHPQDSDARYNYSYALAKLRQQQQQDKQNQQNQQNQKDQKDQKDKQDKEEQKKQQQQQDGQQKQQQRPQPQPGRLSEQQADNMLRALQQDERKVQDKLQQGKAMPVKLEKDW